MTSSALTLVLISAAMHAGWNLLGKHHQPSLAFFTLAMAAGAFFFVPVLVWNTDHLIHMPWSFWGWLLLSGAFQAFYMAGLAWAYARGEASVLYPLARALPVLLVAGLSLWIWQQARPSTLDWAGFLLISIGSLLLPLNRLRQAHWRQYINPAMGWMLLAVMGTVGYSLIDKLAIELMQEHSYPAIAGGLHYLVLQAFFALLFMLPASLMINIERQQLQQLLSQTWRQFIFAGIMILATYALILIAMAHTEQVSHLLALRQASIPIGALIGILLLKESAARPKLIGLGVLIMGLLLVALD